MKFCTGEVEMENDGPFEECMVMRGWSALDMKKYTLEHFYVCYPYFFQRFAERRINRNTEHRCGPKSQT